jgi:hypothetical protein
MEWGHVAMAYPTAIRLCMWWPHQRIASMRDGVHCWKVVYMYRWCGAKWCVTVKWVNGGTLWYWLMGGSNHTSTKPPRIHIRNIHLKSGNAKPWDISMFTGQSFSAKRVEQRTRLKGINQRRCSAVLHSPHIIATAAECWMYRRRYIFCEYTATTVILLIQLPNQVPGKYLNYNITPTFRVTFAECTETSAVNAHNICWCLIVKHCANRLKQNVFI